MRRIVCVWLPRFQTDRLKNKQSSTGEVHPSPAALAIVAPGKGGNRLIAVDDKAAEAGLRSGMLLTDACAIEPNLKAIPQDKPGEALDLKRLAVSCRIYTPLTGIDAPDGLWLDISGAAHLMGGEAALMANIQMRLQSAGYASRMAIASTHGAAWGMARFGKTVCAVIADGQESERCASLSVRALNIAEDKAALLIRLGLKTIGQLLEMPRDTLRSRFGTALNTRLDELCGTGGEASSALAIEPVYRSRIDFTEPATELEAVLEAVRLLIKRVTGQLRENGKGARYFLLELLDTQGETTEVACALAKPSHTGKHVITLFRERFAALEGRFDQHMAFDAATLRATSTEAIQASQPALDARAEDCETSVDALCDRLTARLGQNSVSRFGFTESHIPERASIRVPLSAKASPKAEKGAFAARPFLMLPRPEPVTALAELPDYPPRRFVWRRVSYLVTKAEGPERIAAEWWRKDEDDALLRDYYTVEEESGRRFWLFRQGLYGDQIPLPQWFVHGLFP